MSRRISRVAGSAPVSADQKHSLVEDAIVGPPPGYRVQGKIAEGGMSRIFGGIDLSSGEHVVLKRLRPELIDRGTASARIYREALNLAGVHHPNVVRIRDIFEHGTSVVLVLDFLDGGTLADVVQADPVPYDAFIRLAAGMLAGLDAIHRASLVHRDLKPSNVLLTRDRVPKLADFGIAYDGSRTKLTALGMQVGTAEYMSPEQIRGIEDVDLRTDIYSLGIVFYEMLVGQAPFVDPSEYEIKRKHVNEPPDLTRLAPRAPDFVVAAIGKALSKRREARWQSVPEFRYVLGLAP